MTDRIFVGGGGEGHAKAQHLLLAQANRHGLVAGATGTGKTVTLQILAEGFSSVGVPVFAADVKGDLSGLAMPGAEAHRLHAAFAERARAIGWDLSYRGFPVAFWDVFGQSGTPIRATPAEMGPLLLARMLELTEVQEGVLNVAFRLADEEGLPILDLKDLRALLVFVAENAEEIGRRYGLVAPTSVAAIQRQILILENQGAEAMFGEPALDLVDLMRTDAEGRGIVNILAADRLMQAPRAYATFLLWLLSELFESLPEVGDPEKPRLVFFFDEAHLLFTDAPRALVARIEQLARLIRSKGVGAYFITQNPADLPEVVLGQLGNRVQHGLRAFTPKDQQDLERAARTYRPNPRFAVDQVMRELATGEAVTSLLEPKGVPGVAERTLVRPPQSRLGPITPEERAALVAASPMEAKYRREVDRDSAHERLRARKDAAAQAAAAAEPSQARAAPSPWGTSVPASGSRGRRLGAEPAEAARRPPSPKPAARRSDSLGEAFAKSFVRQIGTRTGQAVVRGLLGSIFKGR